MQKKDFSTNATSFVPTKSIVVEPHEDVPIQLTIGILSHAIVITTFVPPHLRGNPPKPLRGPTITFVQLVNIIF